MIKFKPFKTVQVKNIDHKKDTYSGYIHDWEEITGRKATRCANLDCPNDEKDPKLVGGHVIKSGSNTEDDWYIIPLCHVCNAEANTDGMEVYERDLVEYKVIKNKKK